jgi:hypothetical protein
MINPHLNLTIDEDLRQRVIDFVYSEPSYFKDNGAGYGRKLCLLNKIDHRLSEEIRLFSKQCYESLGIFEYDDEPMFGNLIGVNKEGAFVHPHTDPGVDDKCHVRLNFLIQKPVTGGMPIINGVEYTIEENGCWKNIASAWWHGSSRTEGSKERIILSLGALVKDTIVSKQLLTDDIYQLPNVKQVFGTNVIIQKCPYPDFYSTEDIISNLSTFAHQFEQEAPEQVGFAYTSSTGGPNGSIAHFDYLQPLMGWIRNTVWYNRHYLNGGKNANSIALGRNWINEMYKDCSGIEHNHSCPVAVFYVRIPENGADMIFVNGNETIPAGATEGDLLIHDTGIMHSVSEHRNDISRICLIVEFNFS